MGRVGEEHAHVRQDLSSDEIHKLVEQEAERVARELAEEPSSSLLALSDARREMDDMAMKAQVTTLILLRFMGKYLLRRYTGKVMRSFVVLFVSPFVVVCSCFVSASY